VGKYTKVKFRNIWPRRSIKSSIYCFIIFVQNAISTVWKYKNYTFFRMETTWTERKPDI